MSELLLEVGCEELPATFVKKAYADLRDHIAAALDEAQILEPGSASHVLGTPRRLIVSFEGLKARQEDQTKEQRGPGIKAAYDGEGNPTPALLGFCRGAGVDPTDLRKDDQYVWATKHIPGRATSELLAEILPKAIRSLTFDKTMRWGHSRMRFARPIRWILAAFDGKVVSFDIEGVQTGVTSVGHRFYAPEAFQATTLKELVAGLRRRNVEPEPDLRRERIISDTNQVAGGVPMMPEALIEENVFLTEWPTAVRGSFHKEYLELPVPVLTTAMAKHEKMFPVKNAEGDLTTHFVFIRNSGEDETVRAGNEWVLNARFNDAKFFFDEDSRFNLAHFLEKTSGIVFHAELGTVRQRADRLANLAEAVARATYADDEEARSAWEAGNLAKADLSTGLVSELPALQGIIGGEYARRAKLPDPVCWAIASHYDLSKNPSPDCPGARTAVRVLMADQIDKLAGYLGKGLEPTGSSDPFGLRRAATMLIEACWAWPSHIPDLEPLFATASDLYKGQGFELDEEKALASARDVFTSRYSAMLPDVRYDILEAATASDLLAPRRIKFKISDLEQLCEDIAFVQTATRPLNIVAAARKKEIDFGQDTSSMHSPEGEKLLAASSGVADALEAATREEDAKGLAGDLKSLSGPINDFFESTMVMSENVAERDSRLALLAKVSSQLLLAGDFSRIVVEG